MTNEYPGFCTKTSMIQLGYGIWANLTTMAIGLAYGFPSIQIPQLNSPSSEISVSTEEASWIASILTLFCPIGCLLSGILMDKFGRSVMIMYCHVPMCLGWVYTVASTSAVHMIIARAVLGLGCGMAMGPPRLYTSEISLPNMRGLLGATPNVFLSLGITLQAALGLFLPWNKLCYICGAINIVLFCSYHFLTETPYYLLLRDTPGQAMKALASFRAKDYNLDKEINQLIMFKQDNNIRSLNFREKRRAIFSSSSCLPFGIVIGFITFGGLVGCPIVTFWTIELLLATNSSFDVYEGNFCIAFTRLISGGVTSAILFKAGRKTMALISASGVCFTWVTFGTILHHQTGPSLCPQFFLMMFTTFASFGFYVLPFLLMSELYPLQIRGTLIGVSIAITNIVMFLIAKCFPILRDGLGMPNLVLMFGVSAFFCIIFLHLLLPETKGLTLREIEEYFKNRRSTPAAMRQLSSLHQFHAESNKVTHLSDVVKSERKREGNESLVTPSLISRESKKSVTLLLGKEFMADHDEMETENSEMTSDKNRRDETERKVASNEDPGTSKDTNNNDPGTNKDAEQPKKEDDKK